MKFARFFWLLITSEWFHILLEILTLNTMKRQKVQLQLLKLWNLVFKMKFMANCNNVKSNGKSFLGHFRICSDSIASKLPCIYRWNSIVFASTRPDQTSQHVYRINQIYLVLISILKQYFLLVTTMLISSNHTKDLWRLMLTMNLRTPNTRTVIYNTKQLIQK